MRSRGRPLARPPPGLGAGGQFTGRTKRKPCAARCRACSDAASVARGPGPRVRRRARPRRGVASGVIGSASAKACMVGSLVRSVPTTFAHEDRVGIWHPA